MKEYIKATIDRLFGINTPDFIIDRVAGQIGNLPQDQLEQLIVYNPPPDLKDYLANSGAYNANGDPTRDSRGISYWGNYFSSKTPAPAPVQQVSPPTEMQVAPPAVPTQTADEIMQNAIDAVTSIIGEPPKPYDEVNPFFFDEQLAREAATAEYSPYYSEKLQDYMAEVEKKKSRSQEDLRKTLEFLSGGKEYFLGNERRTLDQALRSSNEGYAGRNLYFSGDRQRKEGELSTESQGRVGEYGRGYNTQVQEAQTGTERTLSDIQTQAGQYQRDIGREQTTAIEGGVLQRRGETLEEYEAARKKYYQAYPNYYSAYYGQ